MDNLRGRAKDTNAPATPDKKGGEAAKAAPAPGAEEEEGLEAQPGEGEGLDEQGEVAKVGEDPKKKGKVNPWKLSEQYKAEVAKKEAEIAELRKLVGDPEARKSELEKFQALEKRAKELEEHIKFVDYSKSAEFTEKYQKPYEEAWGRAMSECKEITFADPNSGEDRNMEPADLLQLVNMPLAAAQELAEERYCGLASTVMAYRKEIRNLHQAQAQALQKAKTEGVEKLKAANETTQRQMTEIQSFSTKAWEEANQEIVNNEKTGQYFRPADGDTEANTRLEKGFKFVDEVMSMNPLDPKLSEEKRKEVVAKHAAVRARAAGFGRVRFELERERAEHAKTKEKLAQYESSTPPAGGGAARPAMAPMSSGRATDSILGALQKLAK